MTVALILHQPTEMLSKLAKATDDPGVAKSYLKYNSRAVWNLLSKGYPLEATLHLASMPGPDMLTPYHRLKSNSSIIQREIQGNTMFLDLDDGGISRTLVRWGSREEEAVARFREELNRLREENDGEITVLECGANIGFYAFIEASVLGEQANIYAVEPDPRNIELLRRGVKENEFEDRIKIVQSAFGPEKGEATLNRSTQSNCSRVGEAPEFGTTSESITVDVQSVDGFLNDHDIEPTDVNVVRMDVEGYESKILEGMSNLLKTDSDLVLFIEIHRRLTKEEELEEVIGSLRDAEFDLSLAVYEPRVREPEFFSTWDEIQSLDWGEKENIELILTR